MGDLNYTYLFADSNVFLECKSLNELPWRELFHRGNLRIIIPRAVQSELDKLKSDKKSRRAKRARSACSMFREIITLNGGYKSILDAKDISVEVGFSGVRRSGSDLYQSDDLDSNRPDDALVIEALTFIKRNPGIEAFLITHDTGPMLTASEHGLSYVPIPDSWLMPPEADDRDREMAMLREEIKSLKEDAPVLELDVLGLSDDGYFSWEAHSYSALSSANVAALELMVARKYVSASDRAEALRMTTLDFLRRYPPSAADIAHYENKLIPQWRTEVSKILERVPDNLTTRGHRFEVSLFLRNDGGAPAMGVIVEAQASKGFQIIPFDAEWDAGLLLSIPEPPERPKGEIGFMGNLAVASLASGFQRPIDLSGFRGVDVSPIRDRYSFYYAIDGDTEGCTAECQEFRHRIGGQALRFMVIVDDHVRSEKGSITIRVSATNLSRPLMKTVPLRVRHEDCDGYSAVVSELGL